MQRVATGNGGPLFGVGAVAAAALLIVGIGWFGARAGPAPVPPTAVARATASLRATVIAAAPSVAASPSATVAATPAPTPVPQELWISRGLGYHVLRSLTISERVEAADDGRAVTFIRPLGATSTGIPSITVLVGTPAHGIDVPTAVARPPIFATDLTSFRTRFIAMSGAVLEPGRLAYVGGGEHGAAFDGSIANGIGDFAMFVTIQQGRDYVIAAAGFDAGTPVLNRAARREALDDFLFRFRFDDVPLYASQGLGFEAPSLTGEPPREELAFGSAFFGGCVTFPGPTTDTWIRVDVGTNRSPAVPPIRLARTPARPGLWAPDFEALAAQFTATYGFGTSASGYELDGRPAMLFEGVGDAGVVIVSLFDDRAYTITTGPGLRFTSERFTEFVRQFQFGPARQ